MTLTAETSLKDVIAWHIYESKIKDFHDGRNETSLCMFPWWCIPPPHPIPPGRTITVTLHCPHHCHAAALMLSSLIWSVVGWPRNNYYGTCCTTNWHHCGCLSRDQRYAFPISLSVKTLLPFTRKHPKQPLCQRLILSGKRARKTWLCTWHLRAQSIDESCSPVDMMLNLTRAWGKVWRQNSFGRR